MVNVTTAVYEPVWYKGSFERSQETDDATPALGERVSAPNEATLVAAVVEEVSGPVQGVTVPDAAAGTVQL